MKWFWAGYFLAGMSFTLLIMGELSLIGTPYELMKFLNPEMKTNGDEYEEEIKRKVTNLIVTLFLVFLMVVGWPMIAIYWNKRR